MRPFSRASVTGVKLCLVVLLLGGVASGQSSTAPHRAKEHPRNAQLFPTNYPSFLRAVYLLAREKESGPSQAPDISETIKQARGRVEEAKYLEFLQRFGLNPENREDIKLEVKAQIARMRRRESYIAFVDHFNQRSDEISSREASQRMR